MNLRIKYENVQYSAYFILFNTYPIKDLNLFYRTE